MMDVWLNSCDVTTNDVDPASQLTVIYFVFVVHNVKSFWKLFSMFLSNKITIYSIIYIYIYIYVI